MILKLIIPLSALFLCAFIQTAGAMDISVASNEDLMMRICIEGETDARKDYSLSEQIDACTALIDEKGEGWIAALHSRAQHYYVSKRGKEALADYDTLVELMPQTPSVWHGRAKSSVRWLGPNQSAIDYLTQAILLSKDRPHSKYFLLRAEVSFLVNAFRETTSEGSPSNIENLRSDLRRAEELHQSGVSTLSGPQFVRLQQAKDLLNMLVQSYEK